jgi:hypothetical protein
LFRDGKAVISPEVAEIFERRGSRAETWQVRPEELRTGRLPDRYFAQEAHRPRVLPTLYGGVVTA